ncbi:MAG: N-acetyl sugar amidotransferase, partial [Leptospiraceae bacterium]|nr:N-acetyl sugar amidotransferase [Leptospiraceae bacterium]
LIKLRDQERPEALDYYLKITGLTEEEFYKVMDEKRLKELKNLEMPVHKKNRPNAEKTIPFVQQLIQKHLNQPDPRIKRDEETK